MATIYTTSDGKEFDWESDARRHQDEIDNSNAAYDNWVKNYEDGRAYYNSGNWDSAITLFEHASNLPTESRFTKPFVMTYQLMGDAYRMKKDYKNALLCHNAIFKRVSFGSFIIIPYANLGLVHLDMGNLENANDYCDKALEKLESDLPYIPPSNYVWLSIPYVVKAAICKKEGNTNVAIEYWKKAADLGHPDGLKNLVSEGIQYTPTPYVSPKSTTTSPSSSSSSSSSSVRKGNIILSILFALFAGGGASMLVGVFTSEMFTSELLSSVAFFAGAFFGFKAWRNKNTVLKIVFVAAFALGILLGTVNVGALFSKARSLTQTQSQAATVTVTADSLNLRAEASGSSDIIKALKKGDVLTVVGDAVSGWLPVLHEGSRGFVSGQYVE